MLARSIFNASEAEKRAVHRSTSVPVTDSPRDFVYLQVVAEQVTVVTDAQNESLVMAKVALLAGGRLEVRLGLFGLYVHSSLDWQFDRKSTNASLSASDSIEIEGGTLRLVLAQPSKIGPLRLKLSWTPNRHLLVVDFQVDNTRGDLIRLEQQTLAQPLASGRLPMQTFEFEDLVADSSYYSKLVLVTNQTSNDFRNASCMFWMYQQNIPVIATELEVCRRVVNGCSMAAYYVVTQELARAPDMCLQCALNAPPRAFETCLHCSSKVDVCERDESPARKFGSRRFVRHTDRAEVIFVLDGTCHRRAANDTVSRPKQQTVRFLRKLTRLANTIERQFRRVAGVKTKLGLVTADLEGKYRLVEPLASRLNVSHLVAPTSGLANLRLRVDILDVFWPPASITTFDFLELFPYSPPSTSRHFVVIDCLDKVAVSMGRTTSCRENDIDFSTARTTILNSHNFIHLITGLGVGLPLQNTPKLRRVIGIDSRSAYLGALPQDLPSSISVRRSLNSSSVSTSQAPSISAKMQPTMMGLREQIRPHADLCHLLALETNGTVFDHRVLGKENRQTLAERIVANHNSKQCQRCDCMLAKDRLGTLEECTLYLARTHTLADPSRLHPDGHLQVEQTWTKQDEDEDQPSINSRMITNLNASSAALAGQVKESNNLGQIFNFVFGAEETEGQEEDDDRDDNL